MATRRAAAMAPRLIVDIGHMTARLTAAITRHRQAAAAVEKVKQDNAARLAKARSDYDAARGELGDAIAAEYLDHDARVGELARQSDLSRETIRRILRTAGIEPDR